MKELLKNKWVRVGLQIASALYFILIVVFAINTFMFQIVINQPAAFATLYVLFNLVFLIIMFFSRKEISTSVLSLFLLLISFCILLFNFGEYILFIPPFIVALVMFFSSRMNETVKTVVGTLYLLIYILGIIIFILVNTFLGSNIKGTILTEDISSDASLAEVYTQTAVDTLLVDNISPDGKLRFYIVDIKNSLTGMVELYVEPNDTDKNYGIYSLKVKGCEKRVGYSKGRGDEALPVVKWIGDNKIQYQFPGQDEKHSVIADSDVKKDYFSFLFT